jgi:pimeloyl-ACP methyl ester carboxylesterase
LNNRFASAFFVVAVLSALGVLVRRYRRDIAAAAARLATTERGLISTRFGDIEYAERGSGEPLLISHGIFQGCDAALTFHDLVPDRRIIAPSRFGYLGSSLPAHATPADQADAYVSLLDALGIAEVDVFGSSAGVTSALQLVLRHPERVKRLVVQSGNLPGSSTAVVQPSWARMVNRQLPIWAIKTLSSRMMARLAGVPKGFQMSSNDAEFVKDFIESMFPITPRVQGVDFDAFTSNADVNGYPLEAISVPTLIVHAKDDPLVSYAAAERASRRIPGAVLLSLESGGHLLLGQGDVVRNEVLKFLGSAAGT